MRQQGLGSFMTEDFGCMKSGRFVALAEKSGYKGRRAFHGLNGRADRIRASGVDGAGMPRIPRRTQRFNEEIYPPVLCYLLLALPVALPLVVAQGEMLKTYVIEDDDDPDANTTFVTLVWNPNPEPNIAGYIVYYGRVSGNYSRLVTVTETTAMIGVRGNRTVYFAVTAFDTNGLESDLSDEVHWP